MHKICIFNVVDFYERTAFVQYIVSTLKTTLKSMLRNMSENDMQRLRKNMSDNQT